MSRNLIGTILTWAAVSMAATATVSEADAAELIGYAAEYSVDGDATDFIDSGHIGILLEDDGSITLVDTDEEELEYYSGGELDPGYEADQTWGEWWDGLWESDYFSASYSTSVSAPGMGMITLRVWDGWSYYSVTFLVNSSMSASDHITFMNDWADSLGLSSSERSQLQLQIFMAILEAIDKGILMDDLTEEMRKTMEEDISKDVIIDEGNDGNGEIEK